MTARLEADSETVGEEDDGGLWLGPSARFMGRAAFGRFGVKPLPES